MDDRSPLLIASQNWKELRKWKGEEKNPYSSMKNQVWFEEGS
jgi:hypothetical protein